jgi:hypothetical protein
MNSVLGEDRTWDGGGETGSENPTTTEVAVSKELDAEASPESQDSNNVSRTGGENVGTGAGVEVVIGVDAVDKI